MGEHVDAQGFQEYEFEVSEDFSEIDILCYRVTGDGKLIYGFLKLDREDDDIFKDLFSSSSILPIKVEYDMLMTYDFDVKPYYTAYIIYYFI